MQRRLHQLEQQGLIRSKGHSKGKRYFSNWPEEQSTLVLREEHLPHIPHKSEADHIPMSWAAQEVCDLIRRPITQRKPVSY